MTDNSSIGPVLHPFIGIPGLPFSEMVEAGRLMFLSGQIGSGADGKLVAGGIKAETRQTLANIAAVRWRAIKTGKDGVAASAAVVKTLSVAQPRVETPGRVAGRLSCPVRHGLLRHAPCHRKGRCSGVHPTAG